MFEKVIVDQNKHWQEKLESKGILREKLKKVISYLDGKHILVITGIRRCGKSYLMKQVLNHLVDKKIKSSNVLFLNLENPYFDEFRNEVKYLEKIFEEYLSLQDPEGRIFVFLDEVQFFKNWQVFVKSKYESEKTKFLLTGSNSWLLSTEYISLLSGRTIHLELFPFSFREFLISKDIDTSTKINILSNENKIRKHLKEYIKWGGFPEIVLNESEEQKKELLSNYYNNIIYRDIVPRFQIANTREIQELAQYLISNIGKTFSYNKISQSIGISDKTVKDYIKHFQDTYLFFELSKYDHSIRKQNVNPKKIYAGDLGFATVMGFRVSEDSGRLLENTVFIELKRRKKEIYYYKDQNECDFVIKEGTKIVQAIQVSREINKDNLDRELKGLIEAIEEYKIKECFIITEYQEEEFELNGIKIKAIPVWKWLLED